MFRKPDSCHEQVRSPGKRAVHEGRGLTRGIGVESVDISLEKQTVLVAADPTQGATYDAVLQKITKTGRTVKGGETVAAA